MKSSARRRSAKTFPLSHARCFSSSGTDCAKRPSLASTVPYSRHFPGHAESIANALARIESAAETSGVGCRYKVHASCPRRPASCRVLLLPRFATGRPDRCRCDCAQRSRSSIRRRSPRRRARASAHALRVQSAAESIQRRRPREPAQLRAPDRFDARPRLRARPARRSKMARAA